jgi:hypothetical protein
MGQPIVEATGNLGLYGVTTKFTLLVSVPPGVVTSTFPVVALVGTVVVISVLDTTLKAADVPLKVTLVEPVNLFPRIMTFAPTVPDMGAVSTQGLRPTDKL